jgi:hypothetical protein
MFDKKLIISLAVLLSVVVLTFNRLIDEAVAISIISIILGGYGYSIVQDRNRR